MEGRRMLIMAASSNEKHFKSIGKFTGDYARILSCYTDAELKIALRFMKEDTGASLPTMDEMLERAHEMDAMLQRANEIGNLPRYILSETLFTERKRQTENSIESLRLKEVKDILNDNGMNGNNSTVHGCIFAVNVMLDSVSIGSESENDDDDDDDDEQSYEHVESDNIQASKGVGYDGQCVPDYGERVVSIMSKNVLSCIVTLSREYVL